MHANNLNDSVEDMGDEGIRNLNCLKCQKFLGILRPGTDGGAGTNGEDGDSDKAQQRRERNKGDKYVLFNRFVKKILLPQEDWSDDLQPALQPTSTSTSTSNSAPPAAAVAVTSSSTEIVTEQVGDEDDYKNVHENPDIQRCTGVPTGGTIYSTDGDYNDSETILKKRIVDLENMMVLTIARTEVLERELAMRILKD